MPSDAIGVVHIVAIKSIAVMDDPISKFLRERNKIKIIVAETFGHCDYARRNIVKRPMIDIIYISTESPASFTKLYGRTFNLDQIYFYKTAQYGKYYRELIDELIWRIGG